MNLRVAISNWHNGQIVVPVVSAKRVRGSQYGTVEVALYWLDRSDNEHLRPASFAGKTADAEKFLQSQGVHLDAQGIH